MRRNGREMAQMYHFNADKLKRNADKLRRDAQRFSNSYSFHYDTDESDGDRGGRTQKEALENELRKDGFLTGDKKKYKVELTDKKLKINGKTMSDDMHQRYLHLLTTAHSGSFKMTIEENND